MQTVPCLCEIYPGICLTTEEKAQKNLSQGSRRMPVGMMKTEYTEQSIHKNMHFYCLIFIIVPTNAHIYIVQNYIANAPTCYSTNASSSGSLYIVLLKS